MSDTAQSADDQRALSTILKSSGAIVAISTSGKLLRVDFRPIAAEVDNERVKALAGSTRLTELYLASTKITSTCVDSLLTLVRLSLLDLQNTSLDDASVQRLANLPELSMLLVRGAAVTAPCVRELRKRFTKIRIVG